MFKNYFRTAWRSLYKNKASSAINIFGLGIGLTCCLLIALYIQHELSYDTFQVNGKRIARVIMEYRFNGSSQANKGNFTSVRVAPVFKQNFPEVESAVKMAMYEKVVSSQERLFSEKRFMFADPAFFDVFTFKLLRGDSRTAISAAGQVVITESTAKKYFGDKNPVGQVLRVDTGLYKVTGVMQNCPSNSQIKFDFIASFSSLAIPQEFETSYWDANYTTYLLLKNEHAISSLQAKLPVFMKKEMEGQGASINFYLEPFRKIHLYSEFPGFEPNNSISYLYILGGVALLILLIACFTYINLSTAQSVERAKEVGIRKVVGAEKNQLFRQFIGESFLICLISVLLSILAAMLLLPGFNQLSGKDLRLPALFSLPFMVFSFLLAMVISFFAGSYPALVLTAFQPVKVLKGAFKSAVSGQRLRKSLMVFQFAISVFLIISTFIIQKQLRYIQDKKLGYDRAHIVVLPMDNKMLGMLTLLKQEFKEDPAIISVSRCVRSPVEGGGGYNMRSSEMPENGQIAVTANPVDEDFIKTAGLEILAGTGFTVQDVKDVSAGQDKAVYRFVINETAARQLGWKAQEAVGKRMFLGEGRAGFVKGVVKDFNFESLHNPMKPFVLFPEPRARELLVKLSGENISQTISLLASKWKRLVPDRPFEFHFLDEDYNKLYSGELRLGKILSLFSSIAIILGCLGLFGLSSYAIKQRMKEISIRRILGAGIAGIVQLLSAEFVKLIAIAIAIATPVAWWAMSIWLQSFAYRIQMGWLAFAAAGLGVILIALATVSFRAIHAAVTSPVKSLRTD